MTETAEQPTTPTVVTPAPPPARSGRLTQVAAWVGIVAGTVFVVAVIFFSGFILGKSADGGGHGHRGGPDRDVTMFHRGGPPPMGPHFVFPGEGPGPGQGPGPGNQPGAPTTVPRP